MKIYIGHSLKVVLCLMLLAFCAGCDKHNGKKTAAANTNITTPTPLLTVKNMQSDFTILWQAIKEMHPGYGFYTPVDSLQRAYVKTSSSINKPLSETDFIALIYPFLCKLRCGHTQIKHSVNYKPDTTIKVPHLPFEVLVHNHTARVTTHTNSQLNTGDEIISINDRPVAEIINHGSDLYCGDGYNNTFKELFLSEYDGFEDACNKYYHWPGPYKATIRNKKGELKTLQIEVGNNESTVQQQNQVPVDNYAGWSESKNTGNLPLRFSKTSAAAYFVTKPFAYADTDIYKEAFKQIQQKGVKCLILDVRHNTGGDLRVATKLLSYLADSPFIIVKDVKARLPDLAINNFANYFDTARTNSFNTGFKTGIKEGNWYHIDSKPEFGDLYGPLSLAKANHFNGKLIVLIDGATFSSGALFTAALKAQRKNATFIGRETAGSEEGCNGVTLQELTLPNTKVIVDFPWMRVISAAKTTVKGRGIMPDYTINYSPRDVVNKTDPDFIKAVSLLK
jgi:Peptidase family S41